MKWLRTLMVSAALCMSAAAAFAADVSYPSVLGGTVVSITPAGTAVKQGDVHPDGGKGRVLGVTLAVLLLQSGPPPTAS